MRLYQHFNIVIVRVLACSCLHLAQSTNHHSATIQPHRTVIIAVDYLLQIAKLYYNDFYLTDVPIYKALWIYGIKR